MRKRNSKGKVLKVGLNFYLIIFYVLGRYIRKRRKEKQKREHFRKYGVDLCCPGCLTWTSEKPWIGSMTETDMHWHTTCQICNHLSHWALWAPVPILDPDFKGPVAERNVTDCKSVDEG